MQRPQRPHSQLPTSAGYSGYNGRGKGARAAAATGGNRAPLSAPSVRQPVDSRYVRNPAIASMYEAPVVAHYNDLNAAQHKPARPPPQGQGNWMMTGVCMVSPSGTPMQHMSNVDVESGKVSAWRKVCCVPCLVCTADGSIEGIHGHGIDWGRV